MVTKLAIIGIRGFPANFPGSSGIDTFVEKIIPCLTKNNQIKISLYTRSWSHSYSNNPQIDIIDIPCLPTKYLDTSIYSIISVFSAISKNDLFWFHAPSSCILLPLLKLFGKKIIFTYHGIDWKRKKWSNPLNKYTLKMLEYFSVKLSNQVTAVSPNLVDYISKKYKTSCLLTPPGFELKQAKSVDKIKKISLKKNKYILYLGRLVPEKRVDWLIKAFLKTSEINKKYKLAITGFIEKNKYCQDLINLSKKNKNIIFTNYVTGETKNEIIGNCKIFVSPSELEGNSLSVNEALEFDKFCLIADLKIHRELAKKNKNIILFQRESFSNFCKKLSDNINIIKSKTKNKIKYNTWKKTAEIFTNFLFETQ